MSPSFHCGGWWEMQCAVSTVETCMDRARNSSRGMGQILPSRLDNAEQRELLDWKFRNRLATLLGRSLVPVLRRCAARWFGGIGYDHGAGACGGSRTGTSLTRFQNGRTLWGDRAALFVRLGVARGDDSDVFGCGRDPAELVLVVDTQSACLVRQFQDGRRGHP